MVDDLLLLKEFPVGSIVKVGAWGRNVWEVMEVDHPLRRLQMVGCAGMEVAAKVELLRPAERQPAPIEPNALANKLMRLADSIADHMVYKVRGEESRHLAGTVRELVMSARTLQTPTIDAWLEKPKDMTDATLVPLEEAGEPLDPAFVPSAFR